MTDEVVTPDRCHSDSSLILEYQQLYNRYAFCLANLRESIKEVQALGQDNESLRLANADLVHRLSLLSRATIHNCLLSDFNRLRISGNDTPSPRLYSREASPAPGPDVIQQNRFQRRHLAERVSLPKSISIRSAGYLKFKPKSAGKYEAPTTQASSPNRVNSPPLPDSLYGRSNNAFISCQEIKLIRWMLQTTGKPWLAAKKHFEAEVKGKMEAIWSLAIQ
nr:zinc finger CCCH domain-containing protein 9-like isoform X2 [Coffea arabica]